MNFQQLQEFLSRISYKDLEICCGEVDYFFIVYLQKDLVEDSETGEFLDMEGHRAYLPKNISIEELFREVYFLCQRWEMHELQEFFKVDGKRPFNPHHTVDELNKLTGALSYELNT